MAEPYHVDCERRARRVEFQFARAPATNEGRGIAALCARTFVQSKQAVLRHLSPTAVCQAGFQVDRQAWRCHNPDGTAPATRPATVVLYGVLEVFLLNYTLIIFVQ